MHLFLNVFIILLIITCLLLSLVMPAKADSPFSVASVAAELLKTHHGNTVLHVIVQTDSSATSGNLTTANASKFVHGKIHSVAPKGGFIVADVSPSEALALTHRSGISHVTFDWPVASTTAPPSNTSIVNSASLGPDVARSYANVAWQNGVLGDGIGIAVVDSGIGINPDLKGGGLGGEKLVAWKDFVGGKNAPYDDYGHGTHVAGILAGSGQMSTTYNTQFPGIAPHANLIGVKVLDSTGAGTTSNVILGIDWCIQNAGAYKIRIINLSLGHPVYESYTTDPLCQEVENAWKAGIVVVVAAGNDGRLNASTTSGVTDNCGYGTCYGSIESPGNDPSVITVGAMKSIDGNRADDLIATYSSRGPTMGDDILKPDIVAYGNLVTSLFDN
ncbi:MAG TPA: S8 family serine peptidase, partial [Capsulimonadaceae bacterium]|nr:S8 family serine peptidase [Capsulimonadaceae bacterium]